MKSMFEQSKWTTIPRRGEVSARIREIVKSPAGQMLIEEVRELRKTRVVNNVHEEDKRYYLDKWIQSVSNNNTMLDHIG